MLQFLLAPLLASVARAELNAGEIEGLTANFNNSGLVTLVGGDKWKPQALITGKYGTKDLNIGQPQTAADTANFPSLFVNPAPGQQSFNADSLYSAILVDAGVVGNNDTEQTLHWLINTIHVNTSTGAGGPWALNYDNGTTITEYAGPGPASGSGPHRYVFLLISQPADFTAPTALSQRNTPVGPINYKQYITDSKLGDIVAANYFTVEEGTATASIPQTQPVESSTISGFTGAAAIPTGTGGNGTVDGGNGTTNGSTNGNGTDGAGSESALTDSAGQTTGTSTGAGASETSGVTPSGSAAPGSSAAKIAVPAAAIGGVVLAALTLF